MEGPIDDWADHRDIPYSIKVSNYAFINVVIGYVPYQLYNQQSLSNQCSVICQQ